MPTLETILYLAPRLGRKEVSPVELTRNCLDNISQINLGLNAFITIAAESAFAEARAAESELAHGVWRGPLHGIPVALKDIIDTAGVRTTAASALYKDRIPSHDAEVVRRLREAGAVIVGKNNLHEFAYGGSSLISFYGEPRNPWNSAHITGGSSGGSAAAVAAGLCYAAIGTDTAGSIREPASLCGCVGFKPTYGRVSSRGVIPLSLSLDHVGPLAATVGDAAAVLQAIAGYDPLDITSANVPASDYVSALREDPKSLRVGVPRAYFFEDLDDEVAKAVEQAIRVIASCGESVSEDRSWADSLDADSLCGDSRPRLSGRATLDPLVTEIKDVQIDIPTDRTLQTAESYACHGDNVAKTPELYQPETLRRIRSGEKISAAEYIQRRRELEECRRRIHDVFATVDLLVTPTTPMPAPRIADLKANPDALRPAEIRLLRNTRPFNVWGLPAISIPCGFTQAGLPIGLQVAGPPWREDLVLRLAHAYEQATAWHKRQPPLVQQS